jgi:hypothetical protein
MRYLFLTCSILLGWTLSTSVLATNDWLKDAYEDSHNIMADPYSADVEADDLFDTNLWLNVDKNGVTIWERDSIFVRFARFLLRLAVILAIPMIIIGALKVIWARGDEWKMKDALQQIGYVAAGILLALASVMIIFLITALTRSSLNFFD